MSGKKIKDPIYGYIELEKDIVYDIIDSAGFQRLRNVRQTSYAPLYPASLHNRFVHSIGVYHLGRMAFDALNKSMRYYQDIEKDSILGSLTGLFTEEEWARCRFLFELACLLHDFGHAPFSHTGEEFYEKSKSNVVMCVDEAAYKIRLQQANDEDKAAIQKELDNERRYDYLKHLVQLTDDIVFLLDGTREAPAEHEIMSCIAALETFGSNSTYFKNNIEKSFFFPLYHRFKLYQRGGEKENRLQRDGRRNLSHRKEKDANGLCHWSPPFLCH